MKSVAGVEEVANYLINGEREEAGKPAWACSHHNITYNMKVLDPADRPAIRTSFEAWARVANITFTQVKGYRGFCCRPGA